MTRTVKELREELAKFRDDAVCYAYEGEVTGIVISPPGSWGGPGVIYCGESADVEPPTENHPSVTSREVLVRASDYDALAADLTSMQMAYEAAHEQAHQMRERAIAAEARLAEAERDAARYRWLRGRIPVTAIHCRGEAVTMMPADSIDEPSDESYAVDVDAAIDAAMGERP